MEQIEALLSAHAASGLTKRDFLKSRGINPATFYYWQKRLQPKEASGFVEVKPSRAYTEVEVHVEGVGWIGLRSADPSSLAQALIALQSAGHA